MLYANNHASSVAEAPAPWQKQVDKRRKKLILTTTINATHYPAIDHRTCRIEAPNKGE